MYSVETCARLTLFLRHVARFGISRTHKKHRRKSSESQPNGPPFSSFFAVQALNEHHGASAWRRRENFQSIIFDSLIIARLIQNVDFDSAVRFFC
jgi:hypothetical protein